MKMQIKKDITALDVWKKTPHGIAVIVLSGNTTLEGVATGTRVELMRVPADKDAAARKLERIRAEHDERRIKRPRLVVVRASAKDDPRNEQFFRRATVIVEV